MGSDDRVELEPVTESHLQDEGYLSTRADLAKEVFEGAESIDAPGEVETETPADTDKDVEGAHVDAEPERHGVDTDAEPVEDEWEGVNPKVRAMLEGIQDVVQTLTTIPQRLKQTESRLGKMQNEFYAARDAAAKVKDSPTKEQMREAAERDEDWEKLKGDFPEWADAIDGRIASVSGGASAEEVKALKDEIAELKEASADNGGGATQRQISEAILNFAHPGYKKTIYTKEYQDFLKTQKPEFVAKTLSADFNDAIDVLDAFEAQRGTPGKTASEIATSRQRRLKTSALPRGKKAESPKAESDMTEQEFRRKAAREVWGDDMK